MCQSRGRGLWSWLAIGAALLEAFKLIPGAIDDSSPSIRASEVCRLPERCVKAEVEACPDLQASASRLPCPDLQASGLAISLPRSASFSLAIALPRSAGLRPRDFPAPIREAGREIARPEASRFACPVLQAQAPDSSELSGSHRARPDWRPLESNLVVSSPAAYFVPLVSCPNK